ncbi:MAG: SDR family oxidoreductase [Selenomonadaceae bacterium]|nr:SDR family oxidoreductase [Selenomonadaceae bacterium]
MLLKNKTAVITGCNRGIGKEILKIFAENGADIFACVRKENENFSELIKNLSEENGVEIIPLYFDMTDETAMKNSVMQIRKTKKKIDILVNNAGINSPESKLFQMTTIKSIREIFEVNFFAQLQLTQYILKFMNQGGSIINMSSISALDGIQGQIAYGSSKAALIGFTFSLAQELGKQNIRVNAVAPGFTDTDMGNSSTDDYIKNILDNSTFGRMGKAEEIAKAVLFLASDLSSFVTGEIFRIDGGQHQ